MKRRLAERAASDASPWIVGANWIESKWTAGGLPVAPGPRRRRQRPPGRPPARRRARRDREHEGPRSARHHARDARPAGRADPARPGQRRGDGHAGRQRDGPRVASAPARDRRGARAKSRGGRGEIRAARLDGDAVRRDDLAGGRAALPPLRVRPDEASCLRRDRRPGRGRREAPRAGPRLQVLRPAAHGARDQALHGRGARQPRRRARCALQRCARTTAACT